jgi:acetoacetate decarboxylase
MADDTGDHGTDDDAFYSVPAMAPLYPEGPYEYPPFTALLLEYPLAPDAAANLVPDPLDAGADPSCVVGIFDYRDVEGFGTYHECMVGIPASFEGRPLFYSPYFVLDSDVPMAAGREIWGIPKIHGQVILDADETNPTATVERNGRELLAASATLAGPTDDHPFVPDRFDNVYRKRIPSASAGDPPALDRLVVARSSAVEVSEAVGGSGDVDVDSSTGPLGPLQPAGDVDATLLEATWTLECVEDAVLHTYDEAER